MVASALLKGVGGVEASLHALIGDRYLSEVAYNLWLVSRCFTLKNNLRDFVSVALNRLAAWQYPDGSWSSYQIFRDAGKDPKTGVPTQKPLPCIFTTALSSLNLLKISTSDSMINRGKLGVEWLLKQQNPDGSWSIGLYDEKKPDIFLTLIALEALIRSNIDDVYKSIDLGLKWVLAQQDKIGTWNGSLLTTILVFELTELKNSKSKATIYGSEYLRMSTAFMNKSSQLSLERNLDSYRLAIITTFQGLEAFMYCILSQPSVNLSIFTRNNPNQTIGLRHALGKSQQTVGLIIEIQLIG